MLSPPPSSAGKGGAGGYAPSPNATSVSGGVTPRITSSPRTKPRGTVEPPWKVPGSRFFTAAAASIPRTTTAGVLWPHPGGPILATPTRPPPILPAWPMEELRMARPAQAWQSPVALGLDVWKDFVGRGGRERVLHPCQPPSFPGVAEPQRSQLAQRCGGLPLPWGSMRHSSAW
ncbi:hypothetical protein R6Z07F_016528 [Ovis aries]